MINLNELNEKEIEKEISGISTKLVDLKFEVKSADLTNVKEYRELKKDLAKALTLLRQRQLGIKQKVSKNKSRKNLKKKEALTKVKAKTKMKDTKVKPKDRDKKEKPKK